MTARSGVARCALRSLRSLRAQRATPERESEQRSFIKPTNHKLLLRAFIHQKIPLALPSNCLNNPDHLRRRC